MPAYIVSHRQHLHGRLDGHQPGQLPLVEAKALPGVRLLPAHGRRVFLPVNDQVSQGLVQATFDQHLHLSRIDGVGSQVGDEVVEAERIPLGSARSGLPVVEVAAVPEEGVTLQGLSVQDGVGLVLVEVDTPQLKRLLDQLPAAQLVPLVGDHGFFLKYLVVRLHHLAPDKSVTAGAPGGGPGGEGGVILVVFPQHQGVGIEGISSGVEEHGQLPLGRGLALARPAEIHDPHTAAAPWASPRLLVL